ncbi:MAG: FGGY-family carbohydrate kinase [Deltaproteobacteria bacterium]|nr:MAG: FGGY-family carbohydrate kinase [Deltaproteobacteria bacterium]
MHDNTSKIPTSNSEKFVLAIDFGSGGHKVAIVADSGEVIASADESVTTHLLPHGGAEQDPNEWWQGAKRAVKKVIRNSNISPEDIVAVACDSQWSVVVPVDAHGEPLMQAVHWLDHRGGPHNRKISGGFPRVHGYGFLKLLKWIKLAGFPPTDSGVDSLGHVLFIKNERPDIYQKTFKFLEPMDYLTARLTGKITATQKTMAPFIIVDNRQWGAREYSDELLGLAGLEKEKFPELIPNDGIVGPLRPGVAQELKLHPSTQVIAGISDSNASVIGSGAVGDYETIIYIGTSQYMTCHVPFKKTDINNFMTSIPSPLKNKYYLFGEQLTGGKCVEFFLKNIVYPDDEFNTGQKPEDAYARFYTIASQSPAGSDGVVFLPWLNGSGVPKENPNARGGFINLSLNTTRSHLTRAIMEGLAYNNRWTREGAEKFIGRKIESFRFSGGGALSEVFSQIHADVLDVPIHQVNDPLNTTVRGTALLALVSLGYRSLEDIASLVKIKKVFEPDESNRAVYDKLYTQYLELFKKNKKVFAALNDH